MACEVAAGSRGSAEVTAGRYTMTMEPSSADTDRPTCPVCGAASVPIVYGYPDAELFEAADRGEVALGGCVIGENDPTHQCEAGHTWGHRT